jgi:hypothetical protein
MGKSLLADQDSWMWTWKTEGHHFGCLRCKCRRNNENCPASTSWNKNDLQLYNASKEDFNSYDFVNDATKHFVREAREKKQIITHAATGLDELPLLTTHDAKEDKKKTYF